MFIKKMSFKIAAIAIIAAFSASIIPIAPVSAALINNNEIAKQQSVQDDRAFVNDFGADIDKLEVFISLPIRLEPSRGWL